CALPICPRDAAASSIELPDPDHLPDVEEGDSEHGEHGHDRDRRAEAVLALAERLDERVDAHEEVVLLGPGVADDPDLAEDLEVPDHREARQGHEEGCWGWER